MIGSGWRIYDYYPALPLDFGFPYQWTLGGDMALSEALHNEDGLVNAFHDQIKHQSLGDFNSLEAHLHANELQGR